MVTSVSVIIPCFNHAHYLPFAIHSVLAQTFTDWEAIIVDDGSTDDTRKVAAQFIDPRIRYTYQENRGLPAARNTGIRAAQGCYLGFLDADDEWEPRFLEICLSELATRESVSATVTLTRFIDESGAALPRVGGQVVSTHEFRARLLRGGFFPPNSILVRAEAVRRAGLFDEALTSVEDWDLWLRITATDSMVCIPRPLARYRLSAGSMSTNAARMHANRITVLTKYFGRPEGQPSAWSEEKRQVYAFAYCSSAFGFLQQHEPDRAWHWLREAAQACPQILARLDTFYELGCGDQPRGFRGQLNMLDIAANGADMLRRLENLYASASPKVRALRSLAFGNAYLAMGMLSDQAGDWRAARRYLLRGIRAYPSLLRDRLVVRRLLKLLLGQRFIGVVRHWRSTGADSIQE